MPIQSVLDDTACSPHSIQTPWTGLWYKNQETPARSNFYTWSCYRCHLLYAIILRPPADSIVWRERMSVWSASVDILSIKSHASQPSCLVHLACQFSSVLADTCLHDCILGLEQRRAKKVERDLGKCALTPGPAGQRVCGEPPQKDTRLRRR